jgi:putative membrane protein
VKRETQNVLVLLLGLGVGVLVVKGAYLHYVKPSLMTWLLIAAALLIALALVCIVRDIRNPGIQTHVTDDDGHRHSGAMVWLLLVPVVLIAFVIPPPIEANGAAPVAAAQPHRRAFPALPAERSPVVSLPEVVMRAATDSAGTLDNRLVTVSGFTLIRDGGVDLGRVVIVCCAADAQLARVHLTGPGATAAAGYPEDTWLRIEGTVVSGSASAAASFVPTMTVTGVSKIDRPANTYAY